MTSFSPMVSNSPGQIQKKPGSAPMSLTTPSASPAMSALKNIVNPSTNAAPAAPDPTVYKATSVDQTGTNAAYNNALNAQQQANTANSHTAQLYAQNADQTASFNAAQAGLSAGGASYLAGSRAANLAGENAVMAANGQNAQATANIYQNQAGTQAGIASTNAGFQQGAMNANTQQAQTNLNNQQTNTTAANQATLSNATNNYNALLKKGATSTSALGGAFTAAQNKYNQDLANNASPAQLQADLDAANKIASGQGYTQDGHSRTDPALKNRVMDKSGNPLPGFQAKRQSDGSTNYVDSSGKVVATQSADGSFTYNGT